MLIAYVNPIFTVLPEALVEVCKCFIEKKLNFINIKWLNTIV